MFLYKNIRCVFTAHLLLLAAYSFSQDYRNSGFVKPMNLPFNLAGSFGEPRKDHFHSGIDIKTNGIEGEPVFAVYDGYISRIRVSPYGYGRAIYITHTNGFTSVYGHLSKFYGAIEKYIHAQHYLQKKSELDLTLDAKAFPVKQNDTIAFSGNTGGSTAPHLHFEIRNTKTEHALNPLDFYPGSFYVDTIPPQLNKVKINQYLPMRFPHLSLSKEYRLQMKDNILSPIDSIYTDDMSWFSFSLEGFDKQDSSENKNGIKKMEIFQNERLVFKFDITEIDFEKTRMCNAFVDYGEMIKDSGYFYNCHQMGNNSLSIYKVHNSNGFFILQKEPSVLYDIYCYDYNDNKTQIKLKIVNSNQSADHIELPHNKENVYKYKIISMDKDSIYLPEFKIRFPENAFYDNTFLSVRLKMINDIDTVYTTGIYNKPLQKAAEIEFASGIKNHRNKIVVVRQNNKGKEVALKTTFDKTKFYAETKELGSFYLKYDTVKPINEIINLKLEILNETKFIQAKITDNLSGIDSYNGYIDNKWVNFYYDAKNDVIQYNFDEYCTKGEHLLKIIVTDNVGNKSTITQKFTY